MNGVSYAFKQAWMSVRRSGRSAVMSMGTITIAFLTLGGFLWVSVNLQRVVDQWKEAAELSIYLQDSIADDTQRTLGEFLSSHSAVAGVEYLSKPRALERFRADFPELTDVTASLSENPFPATFEVRLRPGSEAAEAADALAEELKGRPGVADVRYDRRWLARVISIVTMARVAGFVVAGVLMVGAAFTVAAVVRLSLYARRDEVEIMQLVGAPLSFIWGPFVAEGVLLGGFGAALAFAALWTGHALLLSWLGADMAGALGVSAARFLGVREIAMLILGGVAVGAASGAVASRAAR
ncbi:MAG: cell division protein FtsX [Vicinamibacterales bacterium]